MQADSLFAIAKIQIKQKDFYEAYYNLQRTTNFSLKHQKLQNYKLFAEGVILLMKRKTKQALTILTNLNDKLSQIQYQKSQSDYIQPLIYVYRAYGHFVTDQYEKAIKDYQKANTLDTYSSYNLLLAQGLKAMFESKQYDQAIACFTKASQKLPRNRDPYFLRAVARMR